MILQGNQRSGARNLALHLLSDENEQVEVHELRGFISDDLPSALDEIRAVSRGTRAKQYLYSLSLNPPPSANVSTEDFEKAIEKVEEKLNLSGQPRAVVFHIKNNRRHCHVVWSRINEAEMKAIPLPHTKLKLMEISRDLYIQYGWTMPQGMLDQNERNPLNFSLAQWQQAKRVGKDAKSIKRILQDCWSTSDSQNAFAQALKSKGFLLAKGDRRAFVVLDHRCEIYAVPKWLGLKTKEVKAKISEPEKLPSVDEARNEIAQGMKSHLTALQKYQQEKIQQRLVQIEAQKQSLAQAHRKAMRELKQKQELRWQEETRARQTRLKKGLRALLDRVTGNRTRIQKRNEVESLEALRRDQKEKDLLVFEQINERKKLDARLERLEGFKHERKKNLQHDIRQYEDINEQKRELFEIRKSQKVDVKNDLNF